MKTGKSINELAAELTRQAESRKDYIAPQGQIEARVVEAEGPAQSTGLMLSGLNGSEYGVTPHAHRQFAEHLEIPQKYYDRMLVQQPALLAQNINTWLGANAGEKRMVRTLDGNVRAFMSSRYRALDNFELAETVLPKLIDLGVEVSSCELTETRMYIKGILPDLSDDLPAGAVWGRGHQRIAEFDGNRAGKLVAAIVISNSEVGAGTLRVEPSVFTTWCTNLAVIKQAAMRKYHVGRQNDVLADFSIYRDETRQAVDRAFWLQVQDVVSNAFNRDVFEAAIEQIRRASEIEIESADMPAVVETAVEVLSLPAKSTSGILSMLIKGGDMTQWGLSSAITAAANTIDSYEAATELERAGGELMAMGRTKVWDRIATATAA